MPDVDFPESPRLREIRIREVPVTVALGITATFVTTAWLFGATLDWAFLDFRFWHGEPWRIFTSVFPHVDPLHLIFNLYWLWKMGSLVEVEYGSWRTAALYTFLAIVSSCAQFALDAGGVGLSGIGYGLFGFLLVLRRERVAFARVINFHNSFMFVGWFFLCVALSGKNGVQIGNTAHGSGAIAGLLCGFAVRFPGIPRSLAVAGITLTLIGSLLCASVFRTSINESSDVYLDLANFGYEAHKKGDLPAAAEYFRMSTKRNPKAADTWLRLGSVLQEQNDPESADAYYKAWKLDPAAEYHRDCALQSNIFWAHDAVTRTFNAARAAECYARAVEIDPTQGEIWGKYAAVLHQLGRSEDAKYARERAATHGQIPGAAVDDADSWHNLAEKLRSMNPNEATDAYYKAWQMKKDDPKFADSALDMNRRVADYYFAKELYSRAEPYFKRCLEIRPKDSSLWRKYAQLLQKLGKSEESARANESADRFEQAIK